MFHNAFLGTRLVYKNPDDSSSRLNAQWIHILHGDVRKYSDAHHFSCIRHARDKNNFAKRLEFWRSNKTTIAELACITGDIRELALLSLILAYPGEA